MPPGRKQRRPAPGSDAGTVSPDRPQVRAWPVPLVLVCFAAVWLLLGLGSARERSATFDEPLHLAAGYAALTARDYRLDPAHPPLARLWMAVPTVLRGHPDALTVALEPRASSGIPSSTMDTEIGRQFLYADPNARSTLNGGRIMTMLLAIGLGIVLFLWTREWLGFRAAVFALVFYTLSPNILAHGTLATTDLPVTAFSFATVYFLWRMTRHASWMNVAGLALCFAAAVLSKFSGLVLAPIVAALMLAAVWRKTRITPAMAIRVMLILAGTAYVAVWAVYGFRYLPSASPDWVFRLDDDPVVRNATPWLASLTGWLDGMHLLPNAFSEGLLYAASSSGQATYLLGEYSNNGWWYYFPIAFLVKTPISLVILVAAGVAIQVRRRIDLDALFIGLPIVVFAAVAMLSGVNLGIRHILPLYPFAFVIAGAAANRWLPGPSPVGRVALAGVVAVWFVSVMQVYPNTLTFFNRAVGGPENGLEYLSDSNIDWGQHLPGLKEWMDDTGVSHINLAYFGQADPGYYDIDCTYLPSIAWLSSRVKGPPQLPGFVAISATVLSGVYLSNDWRLFYAGFEDREPLASIGNSIRVYWIEDWPETPSTAATDDEAAEAERRLAANLAGLRWPVHAVRHYRRYLRVRPDDGRAEAEMRQTLVAGLEAFRLLVTRNAKDGRAQLNLAAALLEVGRGEEAAPHAEAAAALLPENADAAAVLAQAKRLEPDKNR